MMDLVAITSLSGTIALNSFYILLFMILVVFILLLAGLVMYGIDKATFDGDNLTKPFIQNGNYGYALLLVPFCLVGKYAAWIFRVSFLLWFALTYLAS